MRTGRVRMTNRSLIIHKNERFVEAFGNFLILNQKWMKVKQQQPQQQQQLHTRKRKKKMAIAQ